MNIFCLSRQIPIMDHAVNRKIERFCIFFQVDMFLDKNRDSMRLEMVDLLSASKSPVG